MQICQNITLNTQMNGQINLILQLALIGLGQFSAQSKNSQGSEPHQRSVHGSGSFAQLNGPDKVLEISDQEGRGAWTFPVTSTPVFYLTPI